MVVYMTSNQWWIMLLRINSLAYIIRRISMGMVKGARLKFIQNELHLMIFKHPILDIHQNRINIKIEIYIVFGLPISKRIQTATKYSLEESKFVSIIANEFRWMNIRRTMQMHCILISICLIIWKIHIFIFQKKATTSMVLKMFEFLVLEKDISKDNPFVYGMKIMELISMLVRWIIMYLVKLLTLHLRIRY